MGLKGLFVDILIYIIFKLSAGAHATKLHGNHSIVLIHIAIYKWKNGKYEYQ